MATNRSGLTQARAYHPRGRTVRERAAVPAEPAAAERAPSPRGRSGSGSGSGSGSASGSGSGSGSGKRADRAPRPGRSAPRGAPARPQVGSGASAPRRRLGSPARRRQPLAWLRPWLSRRARAARSNRPPALASSRRRLRLTTVLCLALFAALGIRLIELQITDGPAYAATGLEHRLHEVALPAARGAIYDRNGAVLARSVEARLVYADPELVRDPEQVAAALQPLLAVPASELVARMQPRVRDDGVRSRYEWLARGVDIAVADEIVALNLAGIGVHRDERRMVPGNDLAANLIGFTGNDLAGLTGREGLEAYFDEVLRGVDGSRTYERGQGVSADREIPGGYRAEIAPQPGSSLRLTLDMDLQYEVQRVLAEQLRAAEATFGAAVLLDARTGEVLAQASYPTYNAADPLGVPPQARTDAATTQVFDPGSAHKPIVFAAAVEEGAIVPGGSLVVDPTIRKGDQTFQDSIWHPAGTRMSHAAIMAYSSNVGTIMIADQLGNQALYDYQQAFGLGAATGVGMPGEVTGGLLPPDQWSGSSYGSVPIGHSVDVTALQLAAAYAVLANGGTWVQPHLVQAVVSPDGDEQPMGEPATRQVVSPETAAYVRELMEAVVTVPYATGLVAAVDGYRVAGKTGTGLLVVDGEYAPGSVSSFIGMAPADNPRYVLAVSAHTPGGGADAVNTAFREAMGFALQHYRVPPATTETPVFDLP